MFENSDPNPENKMSYDEARNHIGELEQNICVYADTLSQSLYSTFQLISIMSYLVIFYYIMAAVVIIQSACLIQAIVRRRITLMRRRDVETSHNEA